MSELRRRSASVLCELRRRRRDGPKPSDKRRNKRWFAGYKQRRVLFGSAPSPLPQVFRRGEPWRPT
jgi:hypothetical protein